MSFKFPDLSSLQATLSSTTEKLQQQLQEGIQTGLKEASTLNQNFSPILKRTTRSLQERFGGIEDISELPKDYTELEKKIDALRSFYKKTLIITEQYEIESYDYPPNIRESFSDYTKIINEKFHGLSQATSTAEAEAVLTASTGPSVPKTFAHSLSKNLKSAKDDLLAVQNGEDNSLTKALLKISEIQYKIGDERLEQDKLIISEFNSKIREILSTDFAEAIKCRRQVETCRLTFDTLRAEVKVYQKGDQTVELPEKLSKKYDTAEDELVNATEVAVQAMKKLMSPVESLNLLKLFTKIQLNYHKSVVEELTSLVDQLESIPEDEE